MTVQDLQPYLGTPCYIRLRCRACGSRHFLAGEIGPGRHAGDVVIEGHVYSVEDVEEIWMPTRRPPGRSRLARLFRPKHPIAEGGAAHGA